MKWGLQVIRRPMTEPWPCMQGWGTRLSGGSRPPPFSQTLEAQKPPPLPVCTPRGSSPRPRTRSSERSSEATRGPCLAGAPRQVSARAVVFGARPSPTRIHLTLPSERFAVHFASSSRPLGPGQAPRSRFTVMRTKARWSTGLGSWFCRAWEGCWPHISSPWASPGPAHTAGFDSPCLGSVSQLRNSGFNRGPPTRTGQDQPGCPSEALGQSQMLCECQVLVTGRNRRDSHSL